MAKLFHSLFILFIATSVRAQSIEQLQAKQVSEQARHQEEVKKAMRACVAMSQDGDVKNRNMAKNVQMELGDTCIVQKPSTDSIHLLNKQINKVFTVEHATSLWSEVNHIALERTVKSVWASYMKLIKDEKLNATSALALICKNTPKLCADPASKKIIQSSFLSFQKDIAKNPIKFLSGQEQNNILHTELKPLIDRANKTCADTKKKYYEIKMAHSCVTIPNLTGLVLKKVDPKAPKEPNKKFVFKPVKQMSEIECNDQLDKAYAKHRALQSIARDSIELDMQLIVGSKLGSLLITESLRKKMGVLKEDFTFNKCMKGEGQVLTQIWNADLLKARGEFYDLTVKELKKIENHTTTDFYAYDKKQTLKQYLKTNPSTVAELLRRNPDPANVYALCSLIKTIQGWDKAWRIVDGIVIGTGVVASIALGFTGIGAPAGAALAGVVLGSTAISITKSTIDYASQLHQDSRSRSAVATQQRNLDQALAELKVSDERKEGYLDNIKFTAGAEIIGFGIGKGLKLLTVYRQARNLKSLAPTVSGLSLADEALMAKKLETASASYQKYSKALGPKSVHLTKVTIDQEAEIANIFTKLSEKDAQLLTKKMSQLKTPEEMNVFLAATKKETAFDLNKLNKLVDGSKKNPPIYIKLEKDAQTKVLYSKLTVDEQARFLKAAKDLKKTAKLDDAAAIKKLSSIQNNCVVKGVFKRGCFQTQLTKIERDIAATSIHTYMNANYTKILDKAKKTELTIKNAKEPVVYDVISIGSGPHNGIAINAMKDVDPNLKVLVIDKSENLGVFHQVKGFDINTPEFLSKSGNTFPGSPTQLKDFNVDKRIFATAEELGEQTQATYHYADVDIVFKNEVMTVTKEPSPGAWPAKWKVETSKGLVVYSKAGLSSQGFGNFATRLKDAKSLEIVEKYHQTFLAKDLVKDAKYTPPISSVDDLIPAVHQDVRLGRNGVDRFDDGEDVLVIGAGDGGNIAIETLTGLNRKLNPSGLPTNVKIKWLSQEAKTGDEFVKGLNEKTIKRYSRIGKTIDSKQVEPINGYLARIEEFVDEAGNLKFKAYYTTKEGVAIGEPIIAKNIVFSTGYPNNQSHIMPMFNKMGDPAAISFQPIKGDVSDFTRYPKFNQDETFTSRQLTVNGEAQDWYSVGVGGKIPASAIEKTGIPVGGSLDVLAPKSASTGKMIAQKVSTQSNSKFLAPSYSKPENFTLKPRPSTKAQIIIENEAVANIDLKLQVGKSLRGQTLAPNAQISVVVSKKPKGDYHFEVNGLDHESAGILITTLGKNPDLTHDLNSFFKFGKSHVEIKVGSRANGQLKLEDLQINTSNTKIISKVSPPAPKISATQYEREAVQLQVKNEASEGNLILANERATGENMGYASINKESDLFSKEGQLLEGFDIDVSISEKFKGQKIEEYLILNSAIELEKQGKKIRSTQNLSLEMRQAWESFVRQGIATRKKAFYLGKEVEIFEFNASAITSQNMAELQLNLQKAKLPTPVKVVEEVPVVAPKKDYVAEAPYQYNPTKPKTTYTPPAPITLSGTLKAVKQKMTKLYVNTIKMVTKERKNMTILVDGGIKLEVGAQLGKGSRGVVSELKSYENLPNLNADGEYVVKLGHTLKGQSTPLAGSTESLKRELEIFTDVEMNMSAVRSSNYYPKNPAWGESMPLCKIHYSMESPEGLLMIKDKIKGKSIDKLLSSNGGNLSEEAEKSLREIYDLNQSLYQKQSIVVDGVSGKFSGDIAKANLMWIDDAASLKQLGYKRPGFVLLELDIHYKNGPRFIEGNMSFEQYKQYIITN